ncbi:hypothetical protein F2Q69_00053300 [Brassica cretica]|uniref:Uncharacterized protein n=1 Tax=Brassica cretica TaxID=69181 RepID=A0A8S9N4N0_BRACR|nr:hypothetical protein F2Q69_00053300 [Brassica cretica]
MEGSPYRKFSISRGKGSVLGTGPGVIRSREPGFLLAGILLAGILRIGVLSSGDPEAGVLLGVNEETDHDSTCFFGEVRALDRMDLTNHICKSTRDDYWGKIFHEEITQASGFQVPASRSRVPAPGPRSPAHQQGPSMLTEENRDVMLTAAYRQENTLNDASPSSYHSVELSTDRLRKRHYIYSCEISQPQPPGGKKRRILIKSKAHAAGNTSSTEDNTLLTSVARSNTGTTYEFLLVHAGPGPRPPVRPLLYLVPAGFGCQSQIRPLQSLVPAGSESQPQSGPLQSLVPAGSGRNNLGSPRHQECIQAQHSATYEKYERSSSRAQHLPAGFTTLTNSKSWRSQKRSPWKYCRHTRQPRRGGYNALEYLSNSTGVVQRKEPCPSAGNTAAPPSTKEPEKMLTLQQEVLVLIPSTHFGAKGSKRSRRTHVPTTIHLKEKAKPPGSGSQLPGFRSKVPTTLLPLFLAMYPDIPLRMT